MGGQFGDGTTTQRNAFVKVVDSGVKEVIAGLYWSALLNDKNELCVTGYNLSARSGLVIKRMLSVSTRSAIRVREVPVEVECDASVLSRTTIDRIYDYQSQHYQDQYHDRLHFFQDCLLSSHPDFFFSSFLILSYFGCFFEHIGTEI